MVEHAAPGSIARERADVENQYETALKGWVRKHLVENITGQKHGTGMIADSGQNLGLIPGDLFILKSLGCRHGTHRKTTQKTGQYTETAKG